MSTIGNIGLQRTQSNDCSLGPYRIERPLGFEQLAGKYLARHMATDVPVSLHVFRISEEEKGEFQTEILGRLDHPSIASVQFADRISGQFVVAIDYVEGVTLQEVLGEKRKLEPREAIRILSGVLSALDYIHNLPPEGAARPAHLDLRPSNILLGPNGTVKVIDFRLARLVAAGVPHVYRVFRSPAYMAPEQLQDRPTQRSDLWAVGVLFFEMLLGRLPRAGEFRDGKVWSLPESASEKGGGFAGLPDPCKSIIIQCLQPDPLDRFASARDLAAALAAAGSASGLASCPVCSSLMPPGTNTISEKAFAGIRASLSKNSKRIGLLPGIRTPRLRRLVTAGALLAAALSLVTSWMWHSSRTVPEPSTAVAGYQGRAIENESGTRAAGVTEAKTTAGGADGTSHSAPRSNTAAGREWARLLDRIVGEDYSDRLARLERFTESYARSEEAKQAAEMIAAVEEERTAFDAAESTDGGPDARMGEKLAKWQDFIARETTGLHREHARARVRHWTQQMENYMGFADLVVQSVSGLPAGDSSILGKGGPDPYLELLDGKEVLYRSPVFVDNASPAWYRTVRIYIWSGMKLNVDLWDSNILFSQLMMHQSLDSLPVDGPFQVSSGGITVNLEIRRDR